MKKLVLVFVLFIVFYNMTFGQEPQQPIQTQVIPATQDIVSRMDSISSGDLKETLVENSQDQNKNRKTYTGNEGGTQALFGISIFGRSKNDKDAGTKASRMDLSYEGGVIGKTVPLFGTIGLGWSIGNSSVKIPGQSKTYRTESNTFRIPIYVGGMLGDPEKLHVSIRGGVVRNYLVNYKVNDEKQNLSGTDRSSWNGTVKFTIGVRFLNFMVDYEFPFESGGKGAWLFGAHLGL